MNIPEAVGMPLIVIVFAAHAAVTPAGSPLALPMPVAPVVVWVMAVSGVLIDKVGVEDAAPAVLGAQKRVTPASGTATLSMVTNSALALVFTFTLILRVEPPGMPP